MIKIKNLIYSKNLFFIVLFLAFACNDDDENDVATVVTIDPVEAASAPGDDPNGVISLYSNVYTSVPIDTWNNEEEASTTEQSFIQIAGDDVIQYTNLNFASIEFATNPINAAGMENLHIDIWIPSPVDASSNFKLLLVDVGASGSDFSQGEVIITSPTLTQGSWINLDIPLSDFTGLNTRENLAQIVLSSTASTLYVDNFYFYGEAVLPPPTIPTTAAPTPTLDQADVLSVYSDTYTDIAGTDFNPDWGQSGFSTATEIMIEGNNTRHYPNFNYQGMQFATAQDVSSYSNLHLDYYSVNATALNVFIISSGPQEHGISLTVPTLDGWNSIDIPLTDFTTGNPSINLADIIQLKFDGGDGNDILLDNIYFGSSSGGGSCDPPGGGEFIADGGFEADAGCWELFEFQPGTSTTIVSDVSNGGTNSARIETAEGGNPGIKQTRFGVGTIQPNTTYIVEFDIRADTGDPVASGSVFNAFTFSEAAEGSGLPAVQHTLISGDPTVPDTWVTRSYTFTTASNVDGGISLLIELIGGGPTTTGTIFIDNVSLKLAP